MIEKSIFQTWRSKTDIPASFRYWSESVRAMNPEFRYELWDDADNRSFIATRYPFFLDVYDSYPAEIYRVDAVRYFWLYHFGGAYIDMDSECLRPLGPLCQRHRGAVLGRMGRDCGFEHSIPNAVMLSSRRAPFWLHVIAHLMLPGPTSAQPEHVTGPVLLKRAAESYRRAAADPAVRATISRIRTVLGPMLQPDPDADVLEILPRHVFYPVNWRNPVHQRLLRRPFATGARPLPRAVVRALFPRSTIVTYWASSWRLDQDLLMRQGVT